MSDNDSEPFHEWSRNIIVDSIPLEIILSIIKEICTNTKYTEYKRLDHIMDFIETLEEK